MEAIGGLFSFLGQVLDQRTMVILEIAKHAATRWVTWSASVIKLVYEFWKQGKTLSASPKDVIGGDDTLPSPGISINHKTLPTTHEEDTVDVANDKEDVGDKEDTSKLATKNKRGRSRTRRPRRQPRCKRGVAGEVSKPAGA